MNIVGKTMTKSTITRERIEQYANDPRMCNINDEIRELARMALAAMDSEPDCNERNLFCSTDTARMRKVISVSAGSGATPLYRHAHSALEREQVRREHAEWAQATFGNVGPVGPLKHLSKEALEAADQPGDLSEWADMQFLMWDAQRRAGITDEQITQAMLDKLAVNKRRSWPEPKDGEPRLHIKEQPAPVVPKEKPIPNTLSMYAVDAVAAIAEVKGWNACRAAMLQASPVCTCPSGDGSLRWPCPVHPGNSPVIPGCDGAELLPSTGVVIEMNPANNKLYTPLSTGISITREMIIAGQAELESCIDRAFDSDVNGNSRYYMAIASDAPKRVFCAMLAAAQQEVKGE